ncbi:cobalamin biosynthesis protein CobD [Malaciobacter pacificus]|uniref:Cobalamin biosynthesis protein CobD n=1 Tax=Malaciobacter pacificus TaxID=1080223 RepID=A0A5C2H911_9BACT|nr:adenosylcobinamide-phosphate synthase CbiB [Malaciobacter pacificus]QEP35460.1 adenosylcobinamide-phosphate synthase [Malaciobacter pacificus]GGD49098.1 cobalamin biosynthesis protein CobD [Malaciobacter pacificus]
MFYSIALFAYIIDFIFAEFPQIKYKHPIIFMGDYIKWFEKKFYKDSILQGSFLTISLVSIIFIISFFISLIDNVVILGFLASFTISHKMLFDTVKDVISSDKIDIKREKISMLVSRDTSDLSDSDVNKAAIETYAENLSDGVIAPLFYLVCFGIVGAFVYKAINTLDSMVGYRNDRYEKFGKVSAKLDDIVNYIPARITAVLISILLQSKKAFEKFSKYGKKHESLNAGLPISAMALAINVKLGGPTSYFGKVKEKPYFGDGKENIEKSDVLKSLDLKKRLDIFIIVILILGVII